MKKLVLTGACMALMITGAIAQGVWISQATAFPNVSTGVFNAVAADTNTVWISGYDGSGGGANIQDFSRTINGGVTWTAGVVPAPASHGWSQIFGLDNNTAWALFYNAVVGTGGGLWKTTDGGNTWNQQGVGTIYNASSFPNIVHFWNANEGVTMGDPNTAEYEIYTTTDGGTTWVPVPAANIPNPTAGEYAIVAHYDVQGNTIWFDTNKGRVFKSIDKGLNWTVGVTGIIVPANAAMDICFYDANNGLARLYNATTGANTIARTTDGGATWAAGTATGNMFGSDIAYIPGTTAKLLSTGAAATFIGSSFSYDGGLTWVDIETSAQRTAIAAADSNNLWCGGFTTGPASDGIFKYEVILPVACGDTSITIGTYAANTDTLCGGDSLFLAISSTVTPTISFSGLSWVITNADISGSVDPLNITTLITSYGIQYPAPSSSNYNYLVNDGAIFGGPLPYGTYYWTPVVFGNATGTNPVFLQDLTLDPGCTTTGNSIAITILDPTDPLCIVGINEVNSTLGISSLYPVPVQDVLTFSINSKEATSVEVIITDVVGKTVYTEMKNVSFGENKVSVSMQQQTAGVYFITVKSGSAVTVEKFVKE